MYTLSAISVPDNVHPDDILSRGESVHRRARGQYRNRWDDVRTE